MYTLNSPMKNEKLYALMAICILTVIYLISAKYTKKSANFFQSSNLEIYEETSKLAQKKENKNFTPDDLSSPELSGTLEKTQTIQTNIENPEYTKTEFEKRLKDQLLKSTEEFEKWANENADFFIRYKSLIIKKFRETYDLNNLTVDSALKINLALTKITADRKHEPEVLDFYLELAGIKENHYASVNLKESAFYNLASMTFDREDIKLELCIKFIDQIEDLQQAQQYATTFKSLNPNLSAQLDQVTQNRIDNNSNFETPNHDPRRFPASEYRHNEEK